MTTETGRLAGKTALVTGSTRGLGRTTAETLAREDAVLLVVVHLRREPLLADLADEVQQVVGLVGGQVTLDGRHNGLRSLGDVHARY